MGDAIHSEVCIGFLSGHKAWFPKILYTRMGRFWSRISKDEDLAEMKGHRLGAMLRKLLNPQFDAALITCWTVIED